MDAASPTYLMKLNSRQEVAEQTMAFRFEKPASFTFTPGQFIETDFAEPARERRRRQFARLLDCRAHPTKTSSWWRPVCGTRLSSGC